MIEERDSSYSAIIRSEDWGSSPKSLGQPLRYKGDVWGQLVPVLCRESDFRMALKNGFGNCSLFVLSANG